MAGLNRTWRGRKNPGTHLPVFVEAKNLKPFISKEMTAVLTPLQFRTDKGNLGEGFKAELKEHLQNVTFLMRTCSDWEEFEERLNRAAPKYGDTMPLEFPLDA